MSSPSSPSSREPFLVGDFLVVPELNELRRVEEEPRRLDGEPLRLTAKQMDVLVVLASKPGQPVGKNELFETVWPGVVVGEDNISSCIYELRKAFGDQAYIKTVRGRGYLLSPAVTRPLPDWLRQALEPPKRETAEIPTFADPEPEAPSNPPPVEPTSAESPSAEPPIERFDRQTRRNLVIAFGALALLVAAGLLGIRHWGNFTVGIRGCENRTSERDLDSLMSSLEKRFVADLKSETGETYYRVRDISFLAGTQISCSVSRAEDSANENYALTATITGPSSDEEIPPIRMYAPQAGLERAGGRLIENVRRELDGRVCHMDTPKNLLKARHCLGAGKRLIKSRSIPDAEQVLRKAAEIYTSLSGDVEQREEVVEGLLETHGALSNVYDIQGRQDEAKQQISEALALTRDPARGFDSSNPHLKKILLKIQRRSAQIEGDVETEKRYLDELQDLDNRDPDIRHSVGWFEQTHKRDCGPYALTQFDEAISAEQDPLTRAAYNTYKAEIQMACGQPQEAIETYSLYIDAFPEEADPYDARAAAYIMVGEYPKARTDLNLARNLEHKLLSPLIQKGDLERDLGNLEDARREYQKALSFFGQWPNDKRDILMGLGRLALLRGNMAEAVEHATNALRLKGGNQVQPYWLYGVANLAMGETGNARSALGALEKHFAGTPSKYLREYFYHLKAQLLLADDRGQEALAELEAAIDNNPTDRLFFLAAKAEALEKLGRLPEALAAYQALLAINPKHRRTVCAAARIAESVEPAEAAALYVQARDILGDSSQDPVCQSCLERARAF